jgi:hypothetical protein
MAYASTDAKQQAHELIDRMVPSQVSALVTLLKVMLDPVSVALANAPYDDEPISEDEARDLDVARASVAHGEGIPHEQVLAELGITQEEINNYQGPK